MPRKLALIRKSEELLARTAEQARELLSAIPAPTFEPLFPQPAPEPIPEPAGLADKTTDVGEIAPAGRVDRAWPSVPLSAEEIGVPSIEDEEWLTNPAAGRDRFGLKSIEFGNWLNEEERQTYLYGSMQGLEDMATVMGLPRHLMGFDGRLSLALGARGMGNGYAKVGSANAHFERGKSFVINLAYSEADPIGDDELLKGRRIGKGALAHEWGHALDNFAGGFGTATMASGGPIVRYEVVDDLEGMRGRFERIMSVLLWTQKGSPTAFAKGLQAAAQALAEMGLESHGEYLQQRDEIFARTFETWITYRLDALGIVNEWVAKPVKYVSTSEVYPSKSFIDRVGPMIVSVVDDVLSGKPTSTGRKRKSAPPASRGTSTEVETRDGMIPAYYTVVELEDVVSSHNPRTWSANPKYPKGCQQRDYTSDKAEQRKVEQGAQKLKPKFLLSDTPSALDGPPVVVIEKEIYTLGGNGRTMMAQLASSSTFSEYVDELRDRAKSFGISEEEIDQLDRPFLVRAITVPIDQCALYSNRLNKGLTQDVDITTETVSYARQLSSADLERLATIFDTEDVESLSEALRSPSVQREVIATFRAAGIVNAQNTSQWLDPATNELSALGRLLVEKVLLGAILRDKSLIDAAQSYTARIVRSLPMMIRMQRLPREWDLTAEVEEVIRLESRRRASGQKKTDMLAQADAFATEIDPRTEAVWEALDSGSLKWKKFLEEYVRQAEREVQMERDGGFGFSEPVDSQTVIDRLLGREGLSDRPEESEVDPRLVSVRDVSRLKYRGLSLSPRWAEFLGEIPPNWAAIVAGLPGSGKSTMVLEFADEVSTLRGEAGGIQKHGDFWQVLYAAVEESPAAGGFANRSRITGATSPRVVLFDKPTLDEIRKELATGQYQGLVIDSAHSLTKDLRKMVDLRKEFPNTMMIFLTGMWKDGKKLKGDQDLEHEVDTVIVVESGKATTVKNRFSPTGKTLNVFHR